MTKAMLLFSSLGWNDDEEKEGYARIQWHKARIYRRLARDRGQVLQEGRWKEKGRFCTHFREKD